MNDDGRLVLIVGVGGEVVGAGDVVGVFVHKGFLIMFSCPRLSPLV